jgi:hypothetical protein
MQYNNMRRTTTFAVVATILRTKRGNVMRKFLTAILASALLAPVAVQAQGVPGGAAHGAAAGNREAGPVGAVVGGAVGGVVGGAKGVLGIHHRRYVHHVYRRPDHYHHHNY